MRYDIKIWDSDVQYNHNRDKWVGGIIKFFNCTPEEVKFFTSFCERQRAVLQVTACPTKSEE